MQSGLADNAWKWKIAFSLSRPSIICHFLGHHHQAESEVECALRCLGIELGRKLNYKTKKKSSWNFHNYSGGSRFRRKVSRDHRSSSQAFESFLRCFLSRLLSSHSASASSRDRSQVNEISKRVITNGWRESCKFAENLWEIIFEIICFFTEADLLGQSAISHRFSTDWDFSALNWRLCVLEIFSLELPSGRTLRVWWIGEISL